MDISLKTWSNNLESDCMIYEQKENCHGKGEEKHYTHNAAHKQSARFWNVSTKGKLEAYKIDKEIEEANYFNHCFKYRR